MWWFQSFWAFPFCRRYRENPSVWASVVVPARFSEQLQVLDEQSSHLGFVARQELALLGASVALYLPTNSVNCLFVLMDMLL